MKRNSDFTELADDALINLIKSHNQLAFVCIYDRYWSEMYACAFHIFPHRETCEDLIHDVFLYLWTSRERIEIKSLRDYLYIAIKNKSLNKIRAQKHLVELTEDEHEQIGSTSNSEEQMMVKEINTLFERGMLSLPEKCREILFLSRKENLSNKEIASRLNIAPKTVENQINIALRKIRLLMGDFLFFYFIYFFFG
ncbi:RNA polymerase sigma-70 factor [Pedobacter sp.]|uniref:RNA polymerase sigma-70 factor n=1 Tax=Pedobacter sp. TaxID=1411316 RepID=UPI003D7F33E2